MTVWLTPEREPFFSGTYFPARDGDRGAGVGFETLLMRLAEVFRTRRDEVEAAAEQIVKAISSEVLHAGRSELPGEKALDAGFDWAVSGFDPVGGGFGLAPKFPRPAVLSFLLRYGRRRGERSATDMACETLRAMARGGIRDHVGGGFHRYSVDSAWRIPHFEKMLYDNAQLALAYLEGFQATGDPLFSEVARETLDYLHREMTGPEGGFYSATDADSEGEEGRYFVWSKREILDLLGERGGESFCAAYGVTERGNFEGRNVLFLSEGVEAGAERASQLRKLYEARRKRVAPATDDKILTSWNGLAIAAFARGGFVLNEPGYLEVAGKAASFLLARMSDGDTLFRSHRTGRSHVEGFLEDYAFLAFGLFELFEATGEIRWFSDARRLTDKMIEKFWDSQDGGFFQTSSNGERLPAREKPYYDGAEPSGNAVAALNLLRLESWTSEERYGDLARRLFRLFGDVLEQTPHACPFLLCALDYLLEGPKEIVIVETDGKDSGLVKVLRNTFVPNRVLIRGTEGEMGRFADVVPFARGKVAIGGRTTAYVCRGRTCEAPATDEKTFSDQLTRVKDL